LSKNLVRGMKNQLKGWVKIFANHICDKGSISRIKKPISTIAQFNSKTGKRTSVEISSTTHENMLISLVIREMYPFPLTYPLGWLIKTTNPENSSCR
jgi:hypothetical protein